MSVTQSVTCDAEGCGKVKGETNHWFKVYAIRNLNNRPLGVAHIERWSKREISPYGFDICGEECLLRTISKLIRESAE